jgi:hypothetical protein
MANEKAGLGVQHFIVDVTNKEEVLESLFEVLERDSDLTGYEPSFREDTIELGFKDEASRIIQEYTQENGVPCTIQDYKNACEEISKSISEQEFFGVCEISFREISETQLFVVFVTGGN